MLISERRQAKYSFRVYTQKKGVLALQVQRYKVETCHSRLNPSWMLLNQKCYWKVRRRLASKTNTFSWRQNGLLQNSELTVFFHLIFQLGSLVTGLQEGEF